MLTLLLALTVPAGPAFFDDGTRRPGRVTCSVDVHALDETGRKRSARRVSAAVVPAVVFRGKLAERDRDAPAPTLLFDVFGPSGLRYEVLLARPRMLAAESDGRRLRRVSKAREASLAVAGSSIAWTSMYGKWRVVPRIEGESRPCGSAEHFTIGP